MSDAVRRGSPSYDPSRAAPPTGPLGPPWGWRAPDGGLGPKSPPQGPKFGQKRPPEGPLEPPPLPPGRDASLGAPPRSACGRRKAARARAERRKRTRTRTRTRGRQQRAPRRAARGSRRRRRLIWRERDDGGARLWTRTECHAGAGAGPPGVGDGMPRPPLERDKGVSRNRKLWCAHTWFELHVELPRWGKLHSHTSGVPRDRAPHTKRIQGCAHGSPFAC
eukprot:scaffold870_cov393-Prasinococcus_capsulatus_cf.AAC.29